jgi:hypothetical protein
MNPLYIVGGLIAVLIMASVYWSRRRKAAGQVMSLVTPATRRIGVDSSAIDGGPRSLNNAQRRRRSAEITAYVGLNGSAKTATAIYDILPDLEAGKRVLSTVAILDYTNVAASEEEATKAWEALDCALLRPEGRPLALPHPLWVPLKNFNQILEFRDGVIFLDEVQGVIDARDSLGMPSEVRNLMYQIRRNKCRLVWTTIDWTAADRRLRQVTKTVTLCRGYFPKWEPGEIWGTRRVYYIRTYDSKGFDDFTEARNRANADRRPTALAKQVIRLFGGLKTAISAYDSSAPVLALGMSDSSGMCLTCNGKRSVARCSCADNGGTSGKQKRANPVAGGSRTGAASVAVAVPPLSNQKAGAAAPLPTRRSLREASVAV